MSKNYRKAFYNNYYSTKSNKGNDYFNISQSTHWNKATLTRIKDWLPENKNINILDVGCGSGNLLMLFKNQGYADLTGIDISSEQISVAKALNTNINFINIDIKSFLETSKDKFDLITAFDVVEHLDKEELLETLRLIYDRLNDNGLLIIQTPNAESPWFGAVAFGDFTHEWFYTPSSLEDILLKSGFKNYEVKASKPVFTSLKSSIRKILWELINIKYKIENLSETGSIGSGIYSRVFLACVNK